MKRKKTISLQGNVAHCCFLFFCLFYLPLAQANDFEKTSTSFTVAPTISSSCQEETFCTSNCTNGQATLLLEASTDCPFGMQLNYSYSIDHFNDGSIDVNGTSNDATADYPIGTHLISWTIEDACANTSTCSYLFTIEDCTGPIAKCNSTLATNLTNPATQSVTIDVSEFDDGSFDPCGGMINLLVQAPSLGEGQLAPPTTAANEWTFDCADVVCFVANNVTFDLWAEDENGNWDYCTSTIAIADGLSVCSGNAFASCVHIITGDIELETQAGVTDVKISFEDESGDPYLDVYTDPNGSYSSSSLPPFEVFTVTPTKEDSPLGIGITGDAVTTLDLVFISKHLLNIEYLDSPYKRIAADVDGNGMLNIFDLLELRKLILHLTTAFPNGNSSWRFVPNDYVFPNYPSPFGAAFPESITANYFSYNYNGDFVGIKSGDVNNSVIPNGLVDAVVRNTVGDLSFKLKDARVKKGEVYQVDFKAQDFKQIIGYQFTLDFDPNLLEVLELETGDLVDLSEANFGLHLLEEGAITTSWFSPENVNLENDDPVFRLSFKARQDLKISDVFRISSRYTGAEAYNAALEIMNVNLQFEEELEGTKLVLYQNIPNPFKRQSIIGFDLPKADRVRLTIYDLSGRVLKLVEEDFLEGYQQISINRNELSGSGILYYELRTSQETVTRKMLLLD